MRHQLLILSVTALLPFIAAAEEKLPAELWPVSNSQSVEKDDLAFIQSIEKCLRTHKDAKECIGITKNGDRCGALIAMGACNYQEAHAWSRIGDKFYRQAVANRPQFAKELQASQTAWSEYVEKDCQYQSISTIYEDFPEIPPWLKWMGFSGCVLGHTANRTIELRSNARQ